MDLLFVGWDAASSRHLDRFDLPFWDSLEHSGGLHPDFPFYGTYVSSGNAWTTMTTGVEYDEHRIFGFVHGPYEGHPLEGAVKRVLKQHWIPHPIRRVVLGFVLGNLVTEGGRGANPQSTDVPYKRAWEYLSGEALIFGLPVTYPVWATNGVLVAGIPAPSPEEATGPLVYPLELQNTVFDESFHGYHVDMRSPIHDPDASEAVFCRRHIEKTERIASKYIDLYRAEHGSRDFEFGFLMLRSIDDVLHATTDEGLIEEIYRATDEATSRIVDELDPNDVLIVSDHGMSPVSALRQEKNIKMDHDTTGGMWGGTHPFDLELHGDVTPAILDYYGVEVDEFEPKAEYDIQQERVDESAVQQRLEDLGYT